MKLSLRLVISFLNLRWLTNNIFCLLILFYFIVCLIGVISKLTQILKIEKNYIVFKELLLSFLD